MRKFVSISCLLLLCSSWAASAQAQQATEVPVPEPAAAAKVDFTVDYKIGLNGKPVDSDELAAKRALSQYDESMRNWSLPRESLDRILAESRAPEEKSKFRLNRRESEIAAPQGFRTGAELEWSRQRFADRVADAIYPGFGRIETTYANGTSSRLDYIYTKRCGGRGGLGICWQYRF